MSLHWAMGLLWVVLAAMLAFAVYRMFGERGTV